jgi:NAD(P)H-dependent flavin oxidoreductase YrpB (nitropropane dioxygenase family)
MMNFPKIIQGGMGAGVSHWLLARKVSMAGHLGVVSGTALDAVMVRRLQDGDLSGDMRRALAAFPDQELAKAILNDYFIEGGRAPDQPYKRLPMPNLKPSRRAEEVKMVGNFVEVFLAKEGHEGPIGINFLEKIQVATLSSLYGAMLAKVDCVLMGAGIPMEIPGVIDKFAKHMRAALRIDVAGAKPGEDHWMEFDPREMLKTVSLPTINRPMFIAIISSAILALALVRKASGAVDGFVVEGPTAGGHNAPPRGAPQFTEGGEPIYGPKDVVDLKKIAEIGRPFWLAGGYGRPEKLQEALDQGAEGVQVGTAFAMCVDSGYDDTLRTQTLDAILAGDTYVKTDPLASPTGFPFKVVSVEGTNSEQDVYLQRPRICDLGYLRTAYLKDSGDIGYRCAAEPAKDYLAKGGKAEDLVGRKCLCNALMANIGHGQMQKVGGLELPVVTTGDDLDVVRELVSRHGKRYTAQNVIDYLMSGITTPANAKDQAQA